MSKDKPLVFGFVLFFLRQFFVRSKIQFLMFCLFWFKLTFVFQNHVVVSPFRLQTNGSKQFWGLTLFGRKKNFLPSFSSLVCLSCWGWEVWCLWKHGVWEPGCGEESWLYQEEGVKEGVMGICGRFVCAMFLSLGGSSPPRCSPFLFFDSEWAF